METAHFHVVRRHVNDRWETRRGGGEGRGAGRRRVDFW